MQNINDDEKRFKSLIFTIIVKIGSRKMMFEVVFN